MRFNLSASFLVAAIVLVSHSAMAAAVDENGPPGTVNYFTSAQKARAFDVSAKAGYKPTLVGAFQDGNFFLTATKSGRTYVVTVLRSGQVLASGPMVPMS